MKVELDVSEDSLNNIVAFIMKQMILDISQNNDMPFDDTCGKYLKSFIDVHEFYTTQQDHDDFMKSISL